MMLGVPMWVLVTALYFGTLIWSHHSSFDYDLQGSHRINNKVEFLIKAACFTVLYVVYWILQILYWNLAK